MDDRTEKVPSSITNIGKQNALKRFLTSFGRRFRKPALLPLDSESHDVKVQTEPEREPVRNSGIAQFIQEEVEKKGLRPPNYVELGASNFSLTNERRRFSMPYQNFMIEPVQATLEHPNGYLIGVGVSNIFSLMDLSWEKGMPEGIVLVNVDPKAVQQAKVFVENLVQGKVIEFIGKGDGTFSTEVIYDAASGKANPYLPFTADAQRRYIEVACLNGEDVVMTSEVILKNSQALIRLAKTGNIAVVQQDLFNPDFLEILARLPNLKTRKNVIYTSNVGDWLRRQAVRAWENKRNEAMRTGISSTPHPIPEKVFACFENLRILNPEGGHRNLFYRALARKHYLLEGQDVPPYCSPDPERDLEYYD